MYPGQLSPNICLPEWHHCHPCILSCSQSPSVNTFLNAFTDHKNLHNAQFGLGIDPQNAQVASIPQPSATTMVQSIFQPTFELSEKEAAGAIFGSTSCRAQEQESSQCTSTQMEQPCSSDTLLSLGHPQNQVGIVDKGQS